MSKSLQDQLLGAGLVDNKKAKKISKESRKAKNEKRRKKDTSLSESQQSAKKALADKQIRDRELNLKRQQASDKKAIAAQIHQLVQRYRISCKDGDQTYNFSDDKLVKSVRVNHQISEEIVRGRLCIVRDFENYEIVPKPIADRIKERDVSAVIVFNEESKSKDFEEKNDDDDYYAQFEIPDDLIW